MFPTQRLSTDISPVNKTLQEIMAEEYQSRLTKYSGFSDDIIKILYEETRDILIESCGRGIAGITAQTPEEMRKQMARLHAKSRGMEAIIEHSNPIK
jgi:hypothetical protein